MERERERERKERERYGEIKNNGRPIMREKK